MDIKRHLATNPHCGSADTRARSSRHFLQVIHNDGVAVLLKLVLVVFRLAPALP